VHTLLSTRMLVLKFREIIDVLVYDDPEVGRLVMRCHIACSESLRHLVTVEMYECWPQKDAVEEADGNEERDEEADVERTIRVLCLPITRHVCSGHAGSTPGPFLGFHMRLHVLMPCTMRSGPEPSPGQRRSLKFGSLRSSDLMRYL